MVAGRHGGSRNHEFRDRESDVDKVSKRGEYVDSRGENGRDQDYDRSQARHVERQKERDIRDRARNRQQDVKEREMANGGRSSSSVIRNCESSGNGHTKQSGISRRTVDRELGELSSGSGSDDPSDSRVSTNKNANPDNSAQPVVEKKRKFSPIVWDMDEKRVGVTLKNKSKIANDPPPPPSPPSSSPPPALSLAYHQSVQLEVAEVDQLFSGLSSHSRLEVMTIEVAATADLPESAALESPTMPPNFAAEQLEPSMDEEDYVSSRNISSSRWADEGNSPRDEGEIIDEEVMNKRRKKMTSSLEPLNAGVLSPEAGEFTRDSSQEAFSKSSGSGRQSQHSRSASEDEYQDGELDKNDYMEMDDEDGNGTADSEDENSNSVPDLVVPPQRSINMLQACRSVDDFDKLNKIDEGTYGVVFRARDRKSGEVVALKKVKMEKEKEGFPLTSLREINILLSFHHPSVVDVKEVVVGSKLDDIFMVMEYMEHDLKGLMETMKQPFSQSEVKCLMLQLLEGVKYLHDNWVLHRDLKTSNLLLNNRGELKICDFGLARQYGSPLKPYTQLVVTLWYRAPELLLGAKEYSTAIDMWSVGCIMAEMLAKEPLFNGKNEIDQLGKIYKILGTPNEKIWPGIAKLPGVKVNFSKNPYNKLREKFPPTSFSGRPTLSEAGFDLLNKLLTYDPEKRITAEAALKHEWFREVPLPKSKEFMPTYPAQHAHDRRLRRIMKSPDPLQELREKERRGELIGAGSLFG